jgi:hypothetical protein
MPRTLLTAASSAGTAALLLLAASACGGGDPPASTTATSAAPQNQSAQPDARQSPPGAAGKVAAISGRTLQVQNAQSGQVAVTYTAKTTFTKVVKAAAASVKVGSCVMVRGADEQASGAAAADHVTAASVQLSKPVDGKCGGDAVLRGGPGGDAGTRPSGAPTGAPGDVTSGDGKPGARGGFDGEPPVSGRVTAVDGSTITVAAVSFGAPGTRGAGSTTASPAATPSTSPVEVTTTSATTYAKIVPGTAKDLAVGQCVTAMGEADDTGAVTASAIASQPAVDGECGGSFRIQQTGPDSGGPAQSSTS